jgi:hypothetical protein
MSRDRRVREGEVVAGGAEGGYCGNDVYRGRSLSGAQQDTAPLAPGPSLLSLGVVVATTKIDALAEQVLCAPTKRVGRAVEPQEGAGSMVDEVEAVCGLENEGGERTGLERTAVEGEGRPGQRRGWVCRGRGSHGSWLLGRTLGETPNPDGSGLGKRE